MVSGRLVQEKASCNGVKRHETVRWDFYVIFSRMDLLCDTSLHRVRNNSSYGLFLS